MSACLGPPGPVAAAFFGVVGGGSGVAQLGGAPRPGGEVVGSIPIPGPPSTPHGPAAEENHDPETRDAIAALIASARVELASSVSIADELLAQFAITPRAE